jgi:hypothetical protein
VKEAQRKKVEFAASDTSPKRQRGLVSEAAEKNDLNG